MNELEIRNVHHSIEEDSIPVYKPTTVFNNCSLQFTLRGDASEFFNSILIADRDSLVLLFPPANRLYRTFFPGSRYFLHQLSHIRCLQQRRFQPTMCCSLSNLLLPMIMMIKTPTIYFCTSLFLVLSQRAIHSSLCYVIYRKGGDPFLYVSSSFKIYDDRLLHVALMMTGQADAVKVIYGRDSEK